MTQQEQQLLNGLIQRVNGTQLTSKDADAERLLTGSLGQNLDALYILCQTVLVQQFAMDKSQRDLQAARAEIDSLKQQGGKQEHGSFLGNLFGLGKGDDQPAQLKPISAPQTYSAQPTGYAPVNNQTASPYGYAQQPPPSAGYAGGYAQPGTGYAPVGGGMFGGGGGFLQGAMQTAAGVVAGEFAFRAIEDVFSGFGHGGGRGFEGGNEVVNNYYDNDSSGQSGSLADRLQSADGLDNGISPDIEDRRGDSRGFLGGDVGDNDASSFAEDGNDDNSNLADDSGSFDDGGSFGGGNDDNSF